MQPRWCWEAQQRSGERPAGAMVGLRPLPQARDDGTILMTGERNQRCPRAFPTGRAPVGWSRKMTHHRGLPRTGQPRSSLPRGYPRPGWTDRRPKFPGSRIVVALSLPIEIDSGFVEGFSPVTVAGPRRFLTDFHHCRRRTGRANHMRSHPSMHRQGWPGGRPLPTQLMDDQSIALTARRATSRARAERNGVRSPTTAIDRPSA